MATRHAANPLRLGQRPGAVPRQKLLRLPKPAEPELVRLFLRPFQPAHVAEDPDAQAVFVARRNLAGPEHPLRAARIAQKHIGVVVKLPPRNEGGHVSRQRLRLHPRDEGGEVIGMGADVAKRPADARARGV